MCDRKSSRRHAGKRESSSRSSESGSRSADAAAPEVPIVLPDGKEFEATEESVFGVLVYHLQLLLQLSWQPSLLNQTNREAKWRAREFLEDSWWFGYLAPSTFSTAPMFFLCTVPNCASNHSICGCFCLKWKLSNFHGKCFLPGDQSASIALCGSNSTLDMFMWTLVFAVLAGFLPSYCWSCWSLENLQEITLARSGLNYLCSFECTCVNICMRNLCVRGSYLFATFSVYKFNVLIWTLLQEVISVNINITKLIHKLLSLLTADWLYLNCALGCCFALITSADRNSTLSWKA